MSTSLLPSGVSVATIWTRVYPEEGVLKCPYCLKACWRHKLLERHVSESHGLAQRQWRCSVCTRIFPTKQGVAIHFAGVHPRRVHHPNIVSGSASDDGDEEPETYACSYCDRSLPSQQGLRNHERRWHQGEVSARLAQQPVLEKKKRERWSEEEVKRFKEAIVLRGTKSNTRIAEMVGTKTARQVSSYKIRFLKINPIWETSDPPSISSVTTPSTNSPQNDLSGDSGSSVLSPGSQQLGESAREEGPTQGSPRVSPAGQLSTPSPSLSDLLRPRVCACPYPCRG